MSADGFTADEREALGQRLMLTMTCNHGEDYFGPGAVCETCFANVQRIGRIFERTTIAREGAARDALARAYDDGYNDATTMARCYGHTDHWPEGDERRNSYRADAPAQEGGEQS